MLPVPSVAILATFSGRPESGFTAFAGEALAQATLLFSVITKRSEFPDDPDSYQLAINAIVEMADRIYLEQPYTSVRMSPFNSETIGSYSYSKGTTYAKVKDGEPTGLFWWDLAVDELSLVERSLVTSGSLSALERDNIYTDGDGHRFVLGPADTDFARPAFDINADLPTSTHHG